MSYFVLADVGETLAHVLWEEIQADTDAELSGLIDNANRISLESPSVIRSQPGSTARLSVYLYRIVENPFTKNRVSVPGPVGQVSKPPLSLDLSFIVTPLLKSPRELHVVLGKVMQVFYDRAVISGADLQGSLAGTDQQLHPVLNPANLEEATRVWQALDLPYQLSVCYEVRVAMVASRVTEPLKPVVDSTLDFAEV